MQQLKNQLIWTFPTSTRGGPLLHGHRGAVFLAQLASLHAPRLSHQMSNPDASSQSCAMLLAGLAQALAKRRFAKDAHSLSTLRNHSMRTAWA